MLGLLSGSITQADLLQFLVRLFIILMILPLHEYAHARTAYKLGDDTAAYQGRMTLNPLAHVDPIGALLLLLTGFGWAKPVPIDPTRFNRRHSIRFGMAVTAIAGPLSNLAAALVGTVALRFYEISAYYREYLELLDTTESISDGPWLVHYLLQYFIIINIGLAVFNLLPIPPLDGSKVVGYFTSPRVDQWFRTHQQVVRIVFLILVLSPILTFPMGLLDEALYRLMLKITAWIPRVFG